MRSTIIVVLLSLALAAGVGEAYLRLTGHAPRAHWVNANFGERNWGQEDAKFGWVNRRGTFQSLEPGGAAMSFQADHTRTSRPADEPRTGPRVLLVGCSFTQGYSVADRETYGWRLNERFPGLTVDNYGTGGYSTYQAYLRMADELDRHRADPPALVVLGFFGHQMVRTVASSEWVSYITDRNGAMLVPPHVLLDGQGRLVEWPMEVIPRWPLEERSALVAVLHKAVLDARFSGRSVGAGAVTLETVARMDALARERGVRFLVATLDAALTPGGRETYDRFVADLGARGVAHVDCVDPLTLQDPASRQVPGGGHPNGDVHRHWADCVGDWMTRNLPVAAASDRARR